MERTKLRACAIHAACMLEHALGDSGYRYGINEEMMAEILEKIDSPVLVSDMLPCHSSVEAIAKIKAGAENWTLQEPDRWTRIAFDITAGGWKIVAYVYGDPE